LSYYICLVDQLEKVKKQKLLKEIAYYLQQNQKQDAAQKYYQNQNQK
tara:strand:+ start:60 stop:200 length:141 start_codon:yes stop_codon:yes gene_type:complete